MPAPDASPDRSPGLTRPFPAKDGGLVRLRLPGGRVTSQVLYQLSDISAEHGDGLLQLTHHGDVQLRALHLEADGSLCSTAANAILATGVVPYSHELVRTILCSPLPSAERPDLHPLVAELDAAILADQELAGLPGSFVWAFDDGAGDIAAGHWDLCYQAVTASVGIVATNTGETWDVLPRQAVPTMVRLAREFVALRRQEDQPSRHPSELGFRQQARYGARLAAEFGVGSARTLHRAPHPALGPVGDHLLAGVPLGLLTPEMVEVLPRGEVTLTPWRQVLVPGAARRAAAFRAAGFAVDPAEPWAHVSACIGSIGCSRTTVDTMAMAERLVDAVAAGEVTLSEDVHVSGCERRCDAPLGDYVDVVAPKHVIVVIDEIDERRYAMDPQQPSAGGSR